jgi:hypothetical protein
MKSFPSVDELRAALPARYQIDRELGRGGFGLVLGATDLDLDREVAIKVHAVALDDEARTRFLLEGRALAKVRSPHVLRVFAADFAGTYPYLVTERLRGDDLSRRSHADPVPAMLEAAEGLAAAHAAGVLHRDIKPANVFCTAGGRVVLIDFGLARDTSASDGPTGTEELVGTPLYMAPEVIRGDPATRASDWFAWNLTLYRLLEGRLPWDIGELLEAARGAPLPALTFPRYEGRDAVVRLLRRGLSRDPDRRPVSLTEIRAILDAPPEDATATRDPRTAAPPAPARRDPPPPRPLVDPSGAIATVLALALLAGFLSMPAPPPPTAAPPPPEPTPPLDPTHQLGAELEVALERGLEGRPPLLEDYAARGAAALATLASPEPWLGSLAAPSEDRALSENPPPALTDFDRSLEAVGMLPVFRPFLPEAGDITDATIGEEAFPESSRALVSQLRADASLPGPWRRVLALLAESWNEHAAAEQAIRRGQWALPNAPAVMQHGLRPFVTMGMSSPASRAFLDQRLETGRERVRRLLAATGRAIAEAPPSRQVLGLVWEGFEHLQLLLGGNAASLTPEQLLGRRPALPWGLALAALIADRGHSRGTAFRFDYPRNAAAVTAGWRRALEAALPGTDALVLHVALVGSLQDARERSDREAGRRIASRAVPVFERLVAPNPVDPRIRTLVAWAAGEGGDAG